MQREEPYLPLAYNVRNLNKSNFTFYKKFGTVVWDFRNLFFFMNRYSIGPGFTPFSVAIIRRNSTKSFRAPHINTRKPALFSHFLMQKCSLPAYWNAKNKHFSRFATLNVSRYFLRMETRKVWGYQKMFCNAENEQFLHSEARKVNIYNRRKQETELHAPCVPKSSKVFQSVP